MVLGILAVLEEHGPMTREAIAYALEKTSHAVAGVVNRLAKKSKLRPKRIYVKTYQRVSGVGTRDYLRAVYAIGNRPDAKKPPPLTRNEVARRYEHRIKARVGSVFHLGESRLKRRARVKAMLQTGQ